MRVVLWPQAARPSMWAILLVFALSPPAFSECRASAQLQRQVEFSRDEEKALGSYSRGLIYLDAGCLDDAERELRTAEQVLGGETNPGVHRKELRGLAKAALDFVGAQRSIQRGERQAAVTALFALFQGYPASVVTLRAVLALSSLLPAGAPQWKDLEQDLETLANLGHWQARKALVDRQIASGQAAAAAASLERRLRDSENLQEAHAIRILLAEAYGASGRAPEAWLLIRHEDRAGGEEILDWQLRIEFLRVAAGIAGARAAQGDPEAAVAQALYRAAYQEVNVQ